VIAERSARQQAAKEAIVGLLPPCSEVDITITREPTVVVYSAGEVSADVRAQVEEAAAALGVTVAYGNRR
jgi:hypothetical protein